MTDVTHHTSFSHVFPEYASGNIYIRIMQFNSYRRVVNAHKHSFDHTTYCVSGSFRVEKLDDDENVLNHKIMKPGDFVLIEANTAHRITAITNEALGHCIYAHRNPQGEIVQEFTGWGRAYL